MKQIAEDILVGFLILLFGLIVGGIGVGIVCAFGWLLLHHHFVFLIIAILILCFVIGYDVRMSNR